jgi:methyl-accepting chemotaxis protein
MSAKMTLRTKLVTMILGTVFGLFTLFVILLINSREQMMEDRQAKVRNLVEVAYSTVAYYAQEASKGRLSTELAKELAANTLRAMRYDESEYFWINDLSDQMVMHPVRPDLEGKKLDQIKDKNGKFLFAEFNRVVKAQGAGFVDYLWPKPGFDEGVPKLSFVKGFEPWGWVIGSGIYIDDVDARFKSYALELLAWGVAIGGFLAISLMMLSGNIMTTLGGDPDRAKAIALRIASGDLSSPIPLRTGDQLSLLANMSSMQDTLRIMIQTITDHAIQVEREADRLLSVSNAVADKVRQQSDAASAMAASVEEVAVSIDQIKENAKEAYTLSEKAGVSSQEGGMVIHTAAAEMRKISEAVHTSTQTVEALGKQSDQISSIVNTIREIADQTNLLALNAAIEAARAGEQGRGFAVVADEVRKLAERTGHSTREITDMITRIQEGAHRAASSMQTGVAQVSHGVNLAIEAGTAIQHIRGEAQRVTAVVSDISASINEQSTASNHIAHQLETVARMSEESAVAVRESADSAQHLHSLSAALHQAVSRFKTHN